MTLIVHSISDFYKYNFTDVLFLIMRPNSNIISEFIFGSILCFSGLQILIKSKNWLNSLKIVTLGIITYLTSSLTLRLFRTNFDLNSIIYSAVLILIALGVYKMTSYMIDKNELVWNIKKEPNNLIVGIISGLFPFLF